MLDMSGVYLNQNRDWCADSTKDHNRHLRLCHDELSDLNGFEDFRTFDLTSASAVENESSSSLTCVSKCTFLENIRRPSVLLRAADLDHRYAGTLLGR